MDTKSLEVFKKHFVSCRVTCRKHSIIPEHVGRDEYLIDPIWTGVDRTQVGGWATFNKSYANRMKLAVEAGAVFGQVSVQTDINARTYISAQSLLNWKRPNFELKKLGFYGPIAQLVSAVDS